MKKTFLILAVLLAFVFTSCDGNEIAVWHTNYDEALEIAKAENKAVLVFFSGDSWDGMSKDAKEIIYNTEEFCKSVAKDFVLVNIDYSDANDSEEISDEIVAKYMLAEKYFIQMMPEFFVTSAYGHVVEPIPFIPEEQIEPKEVAKLYKAHAKRAKQLTSTVKKLETTEGFDRVKLINELYENSPKSHLFALNDYFAEVITLDPENKSGFLGKFKLHMAYPDSMKFLSEGNIEAAANCFLDLTTGDLLKPEEKQEAFYTVAYIYNIDEETDNNHFIVEYLKKAYEVAPNTELGKTLPDAISEYEYSTTQIGNSTESDANTDVTVEDSDSLNTKKEGVTN